MSLFLFPPMRAFSLLLVCIIVVDAMPFAFVLDSTPRLSNIDH